MKILTNPPAFRKLRGYAFDPSLSAQLDTVDINVITYKVPWEKLQTDPPESICKICNKVCGIELHKTSLPIGEYIEIIDYDPATGVFYPPVDLNDPHLLAQDGLDPSVSSPQFHQQMLYAVIMTTIRNFEDALGRKIHWGEHLYHRKDENGNFIMENGKKKIFSFPVDRLRVYPHALRQGNAYYNPLKKSLLFGYFPAVPANAQLHLPGGTVFTCLSHDIIAHETTHALLDGLHRRYTEPTHPDTRAFHEAFADIVALFQHFTFPGVLRQQIAKTRGNLSEQNLLGELAQQFGKAMGSYGGLRSAIGHEDESGKWVQAQPNPEDYQTKLKFHDRGAILVAAVFDAFLSIYKRRIARHIRIATAGTSKLPDGELHPDLVDQLADVAASTASRILRMCVRALDYCPPVDINFGDYLRAIITSDMDMVQDDKYCYRIAFIEAFQKRGIFPKGIKSMSAESLCYPPDRGEAIPKKVNDHLIRFLKRFKENLAYESDRGRIAKITKGYIGGDEYVDDLDGNPEMRKHLGDGLHGKFSAKLLDDDESRKKFMELTGLFFSINQKECNEKGFNFSYNNATYEIGNMWLASRVTPEEKIVNHVIVTLLQKRGVAAEIEDGMFGIKEYFVPGSPLHPIEGGNFIFRGGATLIFDLDKNCLKYAIRKRISDEARMEQQFRFQNNLMGGEEEGTTYFDDQTLNALSGPFAFMHGFSHQH